MATRINSRNFDTEIKKLVNDKIPACKNLYFHVGYFYFSGFSLIAKSIENKNIKILVGMGADKTITNLSKSDKEKRIDYLRQLSEEVDKNEILDKPEERDSYFIFKKKIQNGSLEVRQTKKPSHPKEFIFEYEPKFAKVLSSPGQSLVGSPNLTESGFITNQELATLHTDKEFFNEAKQDFKEAWDDSIPLIDKENFKDFEKFSSKFPFEQKPDPYLMYVRVLDEYFKDRSKDLVKLPKDITENYFDNYKYQRDAIAKGLDILDKHNGVLIADVVGLGKSIIASAIAANLNLRVNVICPPHLKDQWEDYLLMFKISGKVYSSGKILEALEDETPGQKAIIIDEVHKFRNEETKDYLNLYQLCHGSQTKKPNKVILLSATPFNNKPSDTFSLIKLFQIPTRSTLQTSINLSVIFENINRKYNALRSGKQNSHNKADVEKLGEEIRNIIEPLVIRRSRIDLKNIKAYDTDLKKQKIFFSDVEDPILLQYELGSIEEIYQKTLKIISPGNDASGYKCARYKPLTYVKPEFINDVLEEGGYNEEGKKNKLPLQQQNIHDFIKRMMVRRFESSTHSFSITLDRIIESNKRIIKYFEEDGSVPVYPRHQLPDLEELFELSTDDNIHIDELDLEEESKLAKAKAKGLYFIKKSQLKENYIIDVKNDLKILTAIKQDWKILEKKEFRDPKTEAIKTFIQDQFTKDPKRKIIIFTEFSDTAKYLYQKIKKFYKRINIYTSNESSSTTKKKEIKDNFDAGVNGKNQKNDHDILIATDTISEGFNLHRAGTIVNYDIPYNPTRVVQRFGRINRMNKMMFKKLYIYNFFPTKIGETEVNLKRITGIKKLLFNAIFGEDTKVLTGNETLESHFQKEFRKIYDISETVSPETYFENFIYDLREYEPDTILDANNISRRVKAKRKVKTKDKGLLIFSKKGDIPRFIFSDQNKNIKNINPTDAFKLFEAKPNEKHINFDKKYDSLYEEIRMQILADQKILPPNKKKKKLINKLELLSRESRHKDYYAKMYKVVKELDGLTKLHLKTIDKISQSSSDKNIREIKKLIPEQLLEGLLRAYAEVELKKDALIITEQIND
jgi:superfamily II DNA or RNA helicase